MKEISLSSSYALDVKLIDTEEKLQQLVKDLSKTKLIAFDTETTSIDPLRADLVGISLAVREGEGFYIPIGHKGEGNQLQVEKVINALTPVMTDNAIRKVGHNIKYDALVLGNYGLTVSPLSLTP